MFNWLLTYTLVVSVTPVEKEWYRFTFTSSDITVFETGIEQTIQLIDKKGYIYEPIKARRSGLYSVDLYFPRAKQIIQWRIIGDPYTLISVNPPLMPSEGDVTPKRHLTILGCQVY